MNQYNIMPLPEDIILYIHKFKHNLHMLDIKKELFQSVMDLVIQNFTQYTSIIYFILVNSTNQEIDTYFKFVNDYYNAYSSHIDFYCYYNRETNKRKISKITEAINIIQNYYYDT